MQSFAFGSVSGSTFAFYFFLLLALFTGFAICRILLEPRFQKILGKSIPRWQALAMGSGIAQLVIAGVYFSSLNGFYRLEIDETGQEIHLQYILPARILILRRSAIAESRRFPSHKNLWQLVLYTPSGAQYSSARTDYASARKAWEYLNAHLDAQPKPEE